MTPRRILAGSWVVFLVYAYPGYMRYDAADELTDSRAGSISDWHSPMLTELWRLVGRAISGPAGMLALQSLLLLVGSYALLRRAIADRTAAIAAACVLLAPPLIATSAVIDGEAQLAAVLVAGAAALASSRPRVRIAGLGLLVVAAGMCDGAALAIFPIVVALWRWPSGAVRWRQVAVATATWLAIAGAAAGIDALLVDMHTRRPDVELAMVDIVGTLDHMDVDDGDPAAALAGVPLASPSDVLERARRGYGRVDDYARGDDRVFDPPSTAGERDALIAARRTLARTAPLAYARHRAHVLAQLLGLGRRPPRWLPLYTKFVPSPGDRTVLEFDAHHSLAQRILTAPVRALARTVLFRPWLYAIAALVLVGVAAVRRRGLALVVLASGLCYELARGLETARPDYRDSHWLIVATALALALAIARPRSELGDERVGDETALGVADDHRV